MDAFKILEHNRLTYKLKPYSIRQLFYLHKAPVDVFGIRRGIFEIIIKKGAPITKDMVRELIAQKQLKIFIPHEQSDSLVSAQQENLRRVTRSLSVGDPLKNGKLQMNLLTIHMEFLYQNPTNDDMLNLQYQSIKNLATFLIQHLSDHEKLYNNYVKQKHHYVFAQPMISSLFLVGVLKTSRMFSDREIESLFITSYFKDIGMSAIPTEKYDQDNLSQSDKQLLSQHATHSVSILSGRLPLGPSHFKIIENHHTFSLLKKELDYNVEPINGDSENSLISGTETVLINALDIIAAMITGRPFREATTIFDSLSFVRVLISDDYPQEFRVIVNYFKSFKSQSSKKS